MTKDILTIADRIIAGGQLTEADALDLINVASNDCHTLFLAASRVKEHFVGNKVSLCSIINAKSGRCPENCAFCAQSSAHTTNAQVYPLVDEEELVSCARSAEQNGARCYGIITSGTGIQPGAELEKICRALRRIKAETGIEAMAHLTCVGATQTELEEVTRQIQRRGTKVYLDYLQNRRGQLIVAPFAVRPLPGATVSMPLEWKEVNARLDPKRFTIRAVIDIIRIMMARVIGTAMATMKTIPTKRRRPASSASCKSRKKEAATIKVSIVRPSNMRSTTIVTRVAALLTFSCRPRTYARTSSPIRAGRISFAI